VGFKMYIDFTRQAVPLIRRLFSGLSPLRPKFCPGPTHVRRLLDRMAMGQVAFKSVSRICEQVTLNICDKINRFVLVVEYLDAGFDGGWKLMWLLLWVVTPCGSRLYYRQFGDSSS